MKARKFNKRERRTAGRATGSLVVQLRFPQTGENFSVRPLYDDAKNAVDSARKFVIHHLRKNAAILDGAEFTLIAEIRAESGGFRRKALAKWKYPDDVERVFDTASSQWKLLEFEDDWSSYETEI